MKEFVLYLIMFVIAFVMVITFAIKGETNEMFTSLAFVWIGTLGIKSNKNVEL